VRPGGATRKRKAVSLVVHLEREPDGSRRGGKERKGKAKRTGTGVAAVGVKNARVNGTREGKI